MYTFYNTRTHIKIIQLDTRVRISPPPTIITQVLNSPRMYDVGRNRQELSFATLLIEMTRAVVHALLIWFICYSAKPCMQTLGLGGTDFMGTVLWTNSIMVVTVRVTFLMRTWNWVVQVAWWSMFWLVMPAAFLYNIGGVAFYTDDGFDAYHTFFRLFSTPRCGVMGWWCGVEWSDNSKCSSYNNRSSRSLTNSPFLPYAFAAIC